MLLLTSCRLGSGEGYTSMDREVGLVVHLARLRPDGEASVECVGRGWREGSISYVFKLDLVW